MDRTFLLIRRGEGWGGEKEDLLSGKEEEGGRKREFFDVLFKRRPLH